MKKLFYAIMIAMTCSLFWSCGKSDSGEPDNPDGPDTPAYVSLEISTTDLAFEATGGQKTFTISCNTNWTISNSSTWCKTNLTSGNYNQTITVTVEAYDGIEQDRNTNLTITAGSLSKVLTVTQKHKDAIILSKDKFDVPQEGDNITVEVKSNIDYQVVIPSEYQSWIKEATKSKAVETKNFNFTVSANEETDKREGYIVFSGNSLKDTVRVYQAQKDQLILTQDTYNIPSEGQEITVELKANVNYDVVIPSEAASWISQIAETKAVRTDQLKFRIEANTDEENNRSAKITIKDQNSELTDTLYVNQIKKNVLILTQSKFDDIPAEGKDITIELKTDTEYEVVIPTDAASWISQISTKAIRTENLNLHIKANDKTEPRSAKIEVNDKNSALSDTVYITQLPLPQEVYGGDVVLSTIDEVKAFQAKGYKKIFGNLTIKSVTTVQHLNNQLEEITGNLNISDLINCDGLYGLKKVGGDVSISSNDHSMSLEGLNNLEFIGGDFVPSYGIADFEGLENLQEIGGNFKVLCDGLRESDIRSFKGLNSLHNIDGNFTIKGSFPSLTDFTGLDNLVTIGSDFSICTGGRKANFDYSISIDYEIGLTSFNGLNKLNTIGGSFTIEDAGNGFNSLVDFTGLENLTTIGANFSCSAGSITSFSGLNKLSAIGGSFTIEDGGNGNSLVNFTGLENLTAIGADFSISVNDRVSRSQSLGSLASFNGLNKLNIIGGSFRINVVGVYDALNALKSFQGLENLQKIGNNMEIDCSDISNKGAAWLNSLTSLELPALTEIGGDFKISTCANDRLTALKSIKLNNIEKLNKNFEITAYNNNSLTSLQTLEMNKLKEIGGDFMIAGAITNFYGTAQLPSLQELKLSGLTTISGNFAIENCWALENLKLGINDISGNFAIENCRALKNLNGLGVNDISGNFAIEDCGALEDISSLNALQNVGGANFSIKDCENLFDFTPLKNVLTNYNGTFVLSGNGYNPTKYQILNGQGKPESNNN